jgi:hypothetical protein
MKKLLVIAAAALTAVLLAAPVVRADGTHDFAVGGIRGLGGVNSIGFSAQSEPNGANPQGYLSQTIPEGKTSPQRRDRFTVTCLAVAGNLAALGLTPADTATLARFPNGRVLRVTDSGLPGGEGDLYGYDNGDASNCQNHVTGGTVAPESGDIVVHDEP